MKKLNRLLAVVLAAATVCGGAMLAACHKYYIDAYCIFDSTCLRLDISYDSAYAGGSVTSFRTSNSLGDIKGEIDKMSLSDGTLTTAIYSDSYLLIEYGTEDGGYHVFMVVKYSEDLYEFECPYGFFDGNQWLMPYHLLGGGFEASLEETNATAELDTEYITSYGVQDFYNFYKNVPEYAATIDGGNLTLQWTTGGATLTLSYAFTQKDDGGYGVTISLGE